MSFLKDGDRWAFPTTIENGTAYGDVGMTLRDYFAAQAMIGDLASTTGTVMPEHMDTVADRAYRLADAMLKRRQTQ